MKISLCLLVLVGLFLFVVAEPAKAAQGDAQNKVKDENAVEAVEDEPSSEDETSEDEPDENELAQEEPNEVSESDWGDIAEKAQKSPTSWRRRGFVRRRFYGDEPEPDENELAQEEPNEVSESDWGDNAENAQKSPRYG